MEAGILIDFRVHPSCSLAYFRFCVFLNKNSGNTSIITVRMIISLILILLASSHVFAQKVGVQSSDGLACWNAALKWDFGCKSTQVPCLCSNIPFLGTVLSCIRERMEDEPRINRAYQELQCNCKYNAGLDYSFGALDKIYFNATLHLMEAKSATGIMMKKDLIYSPVDTESPEFNKQYRAACAAKLQYDLGTIYGSVMIGYWLCVGIIGTVFNFILKKYPEILFRNSPTLNSLRKHLILPATFKGSHSRPVKLFFKMYLSAPTRGQSLILLGYFILNTVLLVVNYDIYNTNPYLTSSSDQLLRYIGNRTGIMAFTQVPLVILFAARNNIFIEWTGWSYDTMQIYHRWVARVMMTHALIHSICFTALAVIGHSITYRWQEVINWRFGNMATFSGIIMMIMAVNSFRSRFYEVFYFLHKCFYVVFMVGLFRHCWDFGWMGWIYASIAVHALERGVRLYNVILSGWINEAYAESFDDNTFRVSVKYSERWELGPGKFCYLRILHKDLFWQAHPFSVYQSPNEEDKNIHFVIKAQGGATATIANYLASQSSRSATLPVMIEGPYGVHAPVEKYDTVFLLAGGMGVTSTYSYALHLQKLARRGQHIVFLWVIQDATPLEWFGEELLALTGNSNIDLQIYITRKFQVRPFSGSDSDENMEDGLEGDRKVEYDVHYVKSRDSQQTLHGQPYLKKVLPSQQIQDEFGYCLHDKRPNVGDEVTKFLKGTKGNMAIVSCGPPKLVDMIRKSIISNLEESEGRVDYFEEAFSW